MTVVAGSTPAAIVPPAPVIHSSDLPPLRHFRNAIRSNLTIWPNYAFDTLFHQKRVFGTYRALVNDPDGVRHVLVTSAANYRRSIPVRRIAKPFCGAGLFVAEDTEGRRQRRLMASSFTPASINVLIPHFQAAAAHLLNTIDGRNEINLSKAFQETALEAVMRALFSMPKSAARDELNAKVRAYLDGPGRPSLFDGIATSDDQFAFATRKRWRFQVVWFAAMDAIVVARRAQPATASRRDMLDLLINLRDADTGETLSSEEIRDQCATMIFAGSETTALLMFWVGYLLALDRDEQERVRAEIATFLPDRIAKLEDLENWPRLRNVLLEALRLYPPLPHILRDAIGPDAICGHDIAPNTQVWISPWVLHRHRKFWDRPTAFLPGRFAGKSAPWVHMPCYMPFGAGQRICIGLQFALAEAQIVLAQLLSRYKIGLVPGKPVLPVGRGTIGPSYEPMFRIEG